MKKLKRLSALALLAVISVIFAACSSDNKEDNNDGENGNGNDTEIYEPKDFAGGCWIFEQGEDKEKIVFNTDGTCTYYSFIEGETDNGIGTYTIFGNRLTMRLVFGDEEETWKYTIKLFKKGSKLILVDSDGKTHNFTYSEVDEDIDNGNVINAKDLVGGTWIEQPSGEELVFNADGTCSYKLGSKEGKGIYGIKGDKLTIDLKLNNSDGSTQSETKKLTIRYLKKESIFVVEYERGEKPYSYTEQIVFINSKDKDDDNFNQADLVGSWESRDEDGILRSKFTFKADGTYTERSLYYGDSEYDVDNGIYAIHGNKLTLNYNWQESGLWAYTDTYRVIYLKKGKEFIYFDGKDTAWIYSYSKD